MENTKFYAKYLEAEGVKMTKGLSRIRLLLLGTLSAGHLKIKLQLEKMAMSGQVLHAGRKLIIGVLWFMCRPTSIPTYIKCAEAVGKDTGDEDRRGDQWIIPSFIF